MTPLRTSLIVLLALGTLGSSCAPQADRRAERRAAPKPVESLFSRYIPWGEHSVETRVGQIGPRVRRLWKADFSRLGLAYPPAAVVLVALKRERQVEVYAGPSSYGLKMVRRVNITAASADQVQATAAHAARLLGLAYTPSVLR